MARLDQEVSKVSHRLAENRAGTRGDAKKAINWALWVSQVLLALIFLFTGATKLVMSIAALTAVMPLSGPFIRFIGVAELLGALGMILPGLVRIRPILTPLAASGLVIVMIGAVACTLKWYPAVEALFPLAVGVLATFVAYGRWRLAPLRGRDQSLATTASPADA